MIDYVMHTHTQRTRDEREQVQEAQLECVALSLGELLLRVVGDHSLLADVLELLERLAMPHNTKTVGTRVSRILVPMEGCNFLCDVFYRISKRERQLCRSKNPLFLVGLNSAVLMAPASNTVSKCS